MKHLGMGVEFRSSADGTVVMTRPKILGAYRIANSKKTGESGNMMFGICLVVLLYSTLNGPRLDYFFIFKVGEVLIVNCISTNTVGETRSAYV